MQLLNATVSPPVFTPRPAAPDPHGAGSLKDVSIGRLACLFRHWTWADEAKARFEHELSKGWDYDENLLADIPFGSYYHWCALLSGFSDAVLSHTLLSDKQLQPLRADLDASLPWLRTCRAWLVEIPSSLEEHPRIVDLLRDDAMLDRLRRIHVAFGQALRDEQVARGLEWLLYEH